MLNNLANAYTELGKHADAELCLRRALAIKTLPNVHYNLASLLLELGRITEAIDCFGKEVAQNPAHYAALAMKVHLQQRVCMWNDLAADALILRKSLAQSLSTPESVFSPFAFISLPGTTPIEQKLCAERWAQSEYREYEELRKQLAFDHNRPHDNRIAVGYLSGDFREHPLATLTAEMFELHDRDRFRIVAYSYGPDDQSAIRNRVMNAFDDFVDIRGLNDLDAAHKIYSDKIDILVDQTGYTENSRSAILALRPAPLQLSHLGYLGTMGAHCLDYLIADHFIVPANACEHYTEKILHLPNCFQPNDRKRPKPNAPSRASCGLPEHAFVFCCFNQSYKITPDMFDIWCKLLQAVPDSVLWLYASSSIVAENLRLEASYRGIPPNRLVMATTVCVENYLARMRCADIFLDTSPYNAGTTCSDALWMGLPVITCAGNTFSSRMAGSLLSALGMSELVTHDLDSYCRLALSLATHQDKLAQIRVNILDKRDFAPLFDTRSFVRDLEIAYTKIMGELKKSRCS